MGTALTVTNIRDRCHHKLKKYGFESVYAPDVMASGAEYIVYDWGKVRLTGLGIIGPTIRESIVINHTNCSRSTQPVH